MSFHLHNLGLNEAVGKAVHAIGVELFSGDAPLALHHYTRAETVESIINGRSLWSTSLADQSDQSELLHAISLIRETADYLSTKALCPFSADVIRRIAPLMEERREWFYIACFCGENESRFHFDTYGRYCLKFFTPWSGQRYLTYPMSNADHWYQRVVYDQAVQRQAIRAALEAIVTAVSRNTSGANVGPAAHWMVDSCARIAANHLLSICVAFKNPKYVDDREWRIVVCPKLNPLSSAPKMADEDFLVAIKSGKRRHIDLNIPRPYEIFKPLLIPPVPFVGLIPDKQNIKEEELASVIRTLQDNGRPDLCPD